MDWLEGADEAGWDVQIESGEAVSPASEDANRFRRQFHDLQWLRPYD